MPKESGVSHGGTHAAEVKSQEHQLLLGKHHVLSHWLDKPAEHCAGRGRHGAGGPGDVSVRPVRRLHFLP